MKRAPAKRERCLMVSTWQDGFAAPKFSLLSSAPIFYATNMSDKHVFQGAQNFVISGGTFNTADTVCEGLRYRFSLAN